MARPLQIEFVGATDQEFLSRSRKLKLGMHARSTLLFAAAFGFCAIAMAQAPPGIVAWWQAEGNANDIVGTNNGTLINGVAFASGESGEAFDISPGSYVAIADAPELNPINAITIEAWIYRRAEVGVNDPIVKKAGPTDGPYSLEFSGKQLCFLVFSGTWQGCCAGSVPFNQWCHVAGTYDGSTISVYVNGALVGAAGASGAMTPSHNPINLGRDPSGNGREYNGLIDEVRIYHRALNQLEIYAVYSGMPPLTSLPSTGPIVPELAPLQQVMTNVMSQDHVSAATLALMKNSKLVFRQGYGWADERLTAVTHPDNLFRLASVSKVLTMSAITKLMDEGVISNSTPVYSYLGIPPWGGVLGDNRITNITVAELLNHSGGWNAAVSPIGDPAFNAIGVSQVMDLNYPAAPTNIISWVFSKPLDFAPGTSNVYSNFGYELLGRVVEKASGMSYTEYIQNQLLGPAAVLNPIGFTNVVQSRSRPGDLAPWEIWYEDDAGGWQRSAVDYPTNFALGSAEGGFYYFESFDAFGGLSASAIGLCSYLLNHWEGGDRRYAGENYGWSYGFFGSLPGAASVLYQQVTENPNSTNGLEFAALFNSRRVGAPSGDAFTGILAAATNITSWPTNGGGEIQWQTAMTNVAENAGSVSVRLIRSGLSTMAVKVSYTTYPTTATASNFAAVAGIATFNPGETNQTITVPIFDTGHAVPYKQFLLELLSASGGCWLGNTLTCIVSIEGTNTTPYFVTEPQSQTAFIGGTATFNATAQGVMPFAYQWRKNGVPIQNATNSQFVLATLLSGDAGNYDVIARDNFGAVTSLVAVLTTTGLRTNCAVSAPAGLISWWSGDGTAGDRIGTNSGILQNGVTYGPGEVGQAFFFDGVSGYMSVNGSGYLTGARTIEAWVFPHSHQGYGMPIATTGVPWQGDMFGIASGSGIDGTGAIYIDHWGGAQGLHSALHLATNTWNHVAFTYDGTTVRFYVNGVMSAPITQSLYDFDLSTLTIGCNLIGGSTTQLSFDGGIDEFRFYNRALTPWEIQAIYAAGTNGMCPPTPLMFAGDERFSKSNGFILNANLRSGQNYYLQATTNLAPARWITLTNFTAGTAPIFSSTDSSTADLPKRFYRLVSSEGASTPPYFVTQPQSQTALVGATALFEATAQGALPLQYEWRKNDALIPNATNSEYDPAILRTVDAGNYDVVARNSFGAVTSLVAVLKITDSSQTNCAICAPIGLISWWTGDGTTADRVGENSAVLQNGVTYGPGEVGEAFFFDGATGYMLVNGSGYMTGPRTIEAWVYPHAHLGWYGMPIATVGVPWQGDMFGIAGNAGCGGTGAVYIDHWGTGCLNSDLQVVTNTWNHVAFTYDGSTVHFYVNGVVSAPITKSLYDFDLGTLTIGCNLIGGSSTQPSLDGGIDDFRIYNRALAPSEIQAIYTAGTNGVCPPTPLMFAGIQSFNRTEGFVLNANLRSGQSYRLQANTNLATTNWTTLTNFTAGTAPSFLYTNKSATNLPEQFYRIVSP
jgi:CubicO group peptidase (beta-lactamase class C family)